MALAFAEDIYKDVQSHASLWPEYYAFNLAVSCRPVQRDI